MDMAYTNGQTEVYIKEIGIKTKYLSMENITGTMAEPTKAIGLTIICMAKVSINGLMVENTRANM